MDGSIAYLNAILLALGAVTLGLCSPGPNILAVIGTAMAQGRRAGLALATGIAAGTGLWSGITLVGVTGLLAAYAGFMTVLKIAGGLYLLLLAGKALRSAAAPVAVAPVAAGPERLSRLFLKGLTVQMTNPKAALTWVAVMSLAFGDGGDAPVWVGLTVVVASTLISLTAHWLYAAAFSTPVMVRAYGRARRWIDLALGVFFAAAGIKLLTSRV